MGIAFFVLIALLLPLIGLAAAVYFWTLLAVVNSILYRFEDGADEQRADGEAPPAAAEGPEGEPRQSESVDFGRLVEQRFELAEQIARRAWHAAVLGVFCIPPLFLYAFWLLYRSLWLKVPLSSAGRCRWWAALAISAGALSPLLLFYLALWMAFWDMKFGPEFY